MAILYRSFSQGQRIEAGLVAQGLPVEWCNRNSASRKYDPSHPSIKLMTMHSAKGLEFPVIFIPAVDRLPVMNDRLADEVRLMYVAMTRAVDRLVVTHVRDSILVGLLKVANQS
jgi:superfamily I DNA/RNA helicase